MSSLPFHPHLSATSSPILKAFPSPHFVKLSHDLDMNSRNLFRELLDQRPEAISSEKYQAFTMSAQPAHPSQPLQNPAGAMTIDYNKEGSPAQDKITLIEFLTGLSLNTQYRR